MTDVNEILRQLLIRRGISEADFDGFFNPSIRDLASPEELPGITLAADVILSAVAAAKSIVIFGDYDCDGVCATAILTKTISTLFAAQPEGSRGSVAPFLPERLAEGYGMSEASVARMLEEIPGVGLVVTVDNGINSIEPIAALKKRGVAVVVTDHHLPGETLPAADALVDPKVESPPSLTNLCGAGVAFLLANRLVSEAHRRGLYDGPKLGGPLLVLAGLATVTDIMPLVGQNRIIVSEALRLFHSCAPLGLQELYLRAARNARSSLTSRDFGFMLGPRINAAGRLASGMDALDLILEDNRERVREYALRIDLNNTERKSIEQKMTEAAMGKVVWLDEAKTVSAAAQVIDLPDGHPGVAGIVAARVMERLGNTVPVCVIAGGRGSARAPNGLNIRDAFVACDEVLTQYGGHAAAGGFSVKDGQVDRFRELMVAHCQTAKAESNVQSVSDESIDLALEVPDVTLELAEAILKLEPYGEGNPEPIFALRGVCLRDVRSMGAEGRHLTLSICSPAASSPVLQAVWWNHGDDVDSLRKDSLHRYDVRFTLAISEYGERHAEMRLLSMTHA